LQQALNIYSYANWKAALYLKRRALIMFSNIKRTKVKGFEAFLNSNTNPYPSIDKNLLSIQSLFPNNKGNKDS
jgi:hypothetical protein